jgi:hypothetical protein
LGTVLGVAVTRYHFEVKDHAAGWLLRTEATLDDLDAAVAHAVQQARSLMSAAICDGRLLLTPWVEVSSDEGEVLRIIPFAEAVDTIHLAALPRVPASQAPLSPQTRDWLRSARGNA